MYNIQTHRRWSIGQLYALRAQVMAQKNTRKGDFPSEMLKRVAAQNKQRFRMENPSVVIHIGDTCLGIHSFRFLLRYADHCDGHRNQISFFPVNFKSEDEYRAFLEEGVISDKAFGR